MADLQKRALALPVEARAIASRMQQLDAGTGQDCPLDRGGKAGWPQNYCTVSKLIEFHEEASAEPESAFGWYLTRPTGALNTRRYLLRRFPFAMVYREFPSFIQIVAAAHGRRRAGYWKKRT